MFLRKDGTVFLFHTLHYTSTRKQMSILHCRHYKNEDRYKNDEACSSSLQAGKVFTHRQSGTPIPTEMDILLTTYDNTNTYLHHLQLQRAMAQEYLNKHKRGAQFLETNEYIFKGIFGASRPPFSQVVRNPLLRLHLKVINRSAAYISLYQSYQVFRPILIPDFRKRGGRQGFVQCDHHTCEVDIYELQYNFRDIFDVLCWFPILLNERDIVYRLHVHL